ncbi:MAG TPA: 5'-methylthioadenosine phosphorylase [Pusillimonas sp.]|jgi:5'-methylthioadenosine phosphorylase|nr:5'-methylthioadenosine phosphorylase [Pusillimonas sp.]HBT31716.1 5'-methylthioadenosine phosphorylase [Pusillimonas sp.]HCN70938.1 5'-methylthioadenosine phosphorylase [Pusillimonas sp.]HCP79545.1 5'-methylthioadenosine phosphorylase [Pusillimonas sp.]|tara:strand:+ start:38676 stop:39521 length:846 start_codon:yes stop_codon:yes gene_type:complete
MLAIMGGTGLYDLPDLSVVKRIQGDTPFGPPSGDVIQGRFYNHDVLFLARHGAGHRLLPHEVNYRANIYALKAAGATMLLGFSAVGSLALNVKPGDLAMPQQYFDFTRGKRHHTFFGQGVAAHVSTAKPVSAALVDWMSNTAQELGITTHRDLTYACIEGPRLGTQAESHFLRQAGCHLVGMTNVPEVFLAREAQMAYATVGLVTDYDCWLDDPAQHVSVENVFQLYGSTLAKAQQVLQSAMQKPLPGPEPEIRSALKGAILTRDAELTNEQQAWLDTLKR